MAQWRSARCPRCAERIVGQVWPVQVHYTDGPPELCLVLCSSCDVPVLLHEPAAPPAADERIARKLVGAQRWLTVPTDVAVEKALRRQALREWNAPLTTERALPMLPVLASIATGLGAVAFGLLLSSGPGGATEVGAAIGFAALVALVIAEVFRSGREARQQRARYTTPDPGALDTYRALAPPGEFRGNLHRLLTLLDREDPDERVLAAEVLRELGRFDEALALLAGEEDSPWSATVAREARRGHRFVARVPVSGESGPV